MPPIYSVPSLTQTANVAPIPVAQEVLFAEAENFLVLEQPNNRHTAYDLSRLAVCECETQKLQKYFATKIAKGEG